MADRPRNRPGRPRLDPAGGETVQMTLRVPAARYDAIYQRASRERVTVAEAFRRQLDDGDERED